MGGKRAVSGHGEVFPLQIASGKKKKTGHVFLIGNCKECWFLLLNSCAEQMGFKPNGYSGSTVNNSDGSISVQTSEFTFNWKGRFLGTPCESTAIRAPAQSGAGADTAEEPFFLWKETPVSALQRLPQASGCSCQ